MMSRRQWACRHLSRWGRCPGISSAGVHPDSRQETRCTSPPWSDQSTGRPPPPSGRCGSRCRCRRRSISRAPGTSGWAQPLTRSVRPSSALTWHSGGTRLFCPAAVDILQFSPAWNHPGSGQSRLGRWRGSSLAGPQSATRGPLTSAGNHPDRSLRSCWSRMRCVFSPALPSRPWDRDCPADQPRAKPYFLPVVRLDLVMSVAMSSVAKQIIQKTELFWFSAYQSLLSLEPLSVLFIISNDF